MAHCECCNFLEILNNNFILQPHIYKNNKMNHVLLTFWKISNAFSVIVGIISHGRNCAEQPGMYLNVYLYLSWIQKTVKDLYKSFCDFHKNKEWLFAIWFLNLYYIYSENNCKRNSFLAK